MEYKVGDIVIHNRDRDINKITSINANYYVYVCIESGKSPFKPGEPNRDTLSIFLSSFSKYEPFIIDKVLTKYL